MSPVRDEIRKMLVLGLPVAGTQVSTMLIGVVDTMLLGRVGVDAIAGASLANVWTFGTLMTAAAVLFGMDPIVAQAHGAGDGARAGRALQRALVLALPLSALVALLWSGTERFLLAAGQEPRLAAIAHAFTVVQIPSIPFFLAHAALRQYLQAREYVRPALFVMLAANVVNALVAWALIFGHFGLPALGVVGAGLAATLTRVFTCVALVWLARALALHRGAWVPWSRESWSGEGLRELAGYGVPIALQMGLEMWAFSGAALVAGRLGAVEVAAHTIALNLASLSFMLPLGIAQGAATRVGNRIGAGDPRGARRAAWVSLGLGAGVMVVSALAFVALRGELPRLYTPDLAVVAACASILPIAAAFQIFDGTQVVGCGILRGTGRVRPALWMNLVGYWVLGLPLGAWLALRTEAGLAGLWWGLALGLAFVATGLVTFVALRGPGRDFPRGEDLPKPLPTGGSTP